MVARRFAVVIGLVALGAAACVPPPPPPPPDTYVALGDSFVAGPLIPNQIGPPYGCLKSDHNYPHLVAPSDSLPKFVDISCSGAQTKDMTEPQDVDPDGPNPPQFTPLDFMTGLVTLGIGGNDIGFSDIAFTCGEAFLTGGTCREDYAPPGGTDTLRQAIDETAPLVDAVLDGIRERAPRADVVVVNYLPIFPEGPDPITGIEGCPAQLPISPDDVPYLRGIQQYLNQMLADQAAANGATLVDAYTAGIGHDACKDPITRWVEPAVFVPLAAPVHPNAAGMQGVANAVLAAL